MLFPEGGFLRKRRETSQLFAKKHDLPHLTHVTLPRLGATQVILKTLSAQQENGSVSSESGTPNQRGSYCNYWQKLLPFFTSNICEMLLLTKCDPVLDGAQFKREALNHGRCSPLSSGRSRGDGIQGRTRNCNEVAETPGGSL